jgi:aminopeptidase YwaD
LHRKSLQILHGRKTEPALWVERNEAIERARAPTWVCYSGITLMKKWLVLAVACSLAFAVATRRIPAHAQEKPTEDHSPVNSPTSSPRVCALCVRAHEEFLASDALQGRGSGTRDELLAATYVASQLRQYGITPAGDSGGYVQQVSVVQDAITAPPELSISLPGGSQTVVWTSGREFRVWDLSQTEFSGPLQKIEAGKGKAAARPGAVVLVSGGDAAQIKAAVLSMISAGETAVLAPLGPKEQVLSSDADQIPNLPALLEGAKRTELGGSFNLLKLTSDAIHSLEQMPDDTMLHFTASSEAKKTSTWNAIGILRGRDPSARGAVLLSAHLDHLGIGVPVNGDDIYNGADDDASGTTAVLELARVLGRGPRPRRTVVFALFGSEELGGLGSSYFREHPPLPLQEIAVNLEFEMIGRRDPSVRGDTLWLTGWERSNLGPELAAHGARLVRDPHPKEDFFARSDNYLLALKGLVAQTVSSYGLHADLHQPSDDLAHLDFKHMDAAIGSLLQPIEWLVNSDFRPKWNPGGQP